MATEVSSMARILNGYYFKDDQAVMNEPGKKSTALITHDFLGGSSSNSSKVHDSQELDLDLEVPNGWEKRLDLKSGKVYIQRSTGNSPSSSNSNNQTNQTVAKFQDLNFFPTSSVLSSSSSSSPSRVPLNLFDDTNLDLKLVPTSSSSCTNNYQSVCTLDKVKFALERAERNLPKKRSSLSCSSSSMSNSSSSTKVLNSHEDQQDYIGGDKKSLDAQSGSLLYAAGCPNCLLYVMISKTNPRCPRCSSTVPLPIMKKPRIDLNISM